MFAGNVRSRPFGTGPASVMYCATTLSTATATASARSSRHTDRAPWRSARCPSPPHPRHAPSILDTQAGPTTRPTSPNNPPLTAVFHPHNGTTAAEWRARNAQVRLIFTFWTLVTLHFIMSIFHHRFPKCALCFFPNSISSRPSLFRRHDFCIL